MSLLAQPPNLLLNFASCTNKGHFLANPLRPLSAKNDFFDNCPNIIYKQYLSTDQLLFLVLRARPVCVMDVDKKP